MTDDKAPSDLFGFLHYYLVTKAPFQLPDGVKEAIVKYGPWITVVLLIVSLPPLLFLLGLGTLLVPFAGVRYASGFGLATIALIAQLALMVMALPGLFARKMAGWRLVVYSELVSVVYGLLSGSIVGTLIGGLIGLYLIFQVQALYTD